MTKTLPLSILLALLVTLTGCATTQSGTSQGRDPDLISNAEIQNYLNYSAFELIRELRPNWLRDRGGSINPFGQEDIANPRGIRVYVDGVHQNGGLGDLEYIPATQIRELQKLDAPEATQRFGTGHTAGAILVTTNRG